MADQLQLRRGTTAQNAAFTGAQGEVVVNTDNNTLIVHNGITAGGFSTATSQQITSGTFYYNEDASSAPNAYILNPKANTTTPSSYVDGVQFGFVTTKPNTGPSTANFQLLGVKSLKYAGGIDPPAGEISGRVYLIYDAANDWMEIQRKATGARPQIRNLTAAVSTNAMTITLPPDIIDFRSASLGNGTVNRRTIAASLTLTIPAGASLGTQSGIQNQIAVLALDNAGTVQLAVVNVAGGLNLDETTLLNATAITSGSALAGTVYSTSSATGVPFRVLGYVQSTQAVAGTWATTPSQVQGQGGQTIVGQLFAKMGTSQATTTGTAIDFTGIPAGVNRITLMLSGVSLSGTANYLIQIGSGAVQASGYIGTSGLYNTGGTIMAAWSAGAVINIAVAAYTCHGSITLNRLTGSTWVISGSVSAPESPAVVSIGGSVVVTGIVDRLRITSVGGTNTFDAGIANIMFEV